MENKEKEGDFPIFTLKSKYFGQDIDNILKIKNKIIIIEKYIEETDKKIISSGLRLNMFINSLFMEERRQFNYTKHSILFNEEKNIIYIYTHEQVQQILDDTYYNLKNSHNIDIDINILEATYKPRLKIIANKKQMEICNNMVHEHNLSISDYEYYFSEYEELLFEYTNIIEKIKEDITGVKLFNNSSSVEQEIFDKQKHELMITKNKHNEWEFIYVRKEDKNKLISLIKQK